MRAGGPMRGGGPTGVGRRARIVASVVVLVALAASPAPASAAVPNDAPSAAAPFLPVTAENGAVAARGRTVELDGAGPDAGVPRCLGPRSFERTAWLTVPAAAVPRRLSIEAVARDGSTETPDLAVFVQPGPTGVDVREPQACAGRETAGDPARGDTGAGTLLVVPSGAAVLVQVGWRAGDPAGPVVTTLAAANLPVRPAPAGQAFATAPRIAPGRGAAVGLAGASTSAGDPAQPRCVAQAGVWRRVRVVRRGLYVAAASGPAAGTLTVYGSLPAGDTALSCADDGASPATATVFRVRRARTHWLRVGTDAPDAGARAGLALVGPYPTVRAARAAVASAADRAARALDPNAPCTDRRAPRPSATADAAARLRRGGRVLAGTLDGAACVAGRSTVVGVTVAVARLRGGRCSWRTERTFGAPRACGTPRGARRATGRERWRATLPAALPRGDRYRIVVRAQVRVKGRRRNAGPPVVLGVQR